MLKKWEIHYDDLVQSCMMIREFIEDYYHFRGLVWPDTLEALLFLGSEYGEVCDTAVAKQADWIRNNPTTKQHEALSSELGDVIMMAMVAAISENDSNALLAMVNKCLMKCKELEREAS